MKVLIIGQGGREHALVKSLARAPSVSEIHVVPGNDGMSREALCHPLDWRETETLIGFCIRTEIDFVFIGPEDPLVEGLAEKLRERGILAVGPNQEAARLEGSKIFAKTFMEQAGVPTAPFAIVESVEATLAAAKNFTPPYVLKADGLAAGKGVFICKTLPELEESARDLFERRTLGSAGAQALLEQFQPGWELSYLVLTNGHASRALPIAQDHKRLRDHDEGPNTGGMGTVAPLVIDATLRARIEKEIVAPSIRLLEQKGLVFRGVLFIGLMITENGPTVLEYNVRFGDPETQVILPLLDVDAGLLFHELACGRLMDFNLRQMHSACVIEAAEGYPDQPVKGTPIVGDLSDESATAYFIHAGTKRSNEGGWLVNGGRVLGAVGLGSSMREAVSAAYSQSSKARWKGQQKRGDIGQKVL